MYLWHVEDVISMLLHFQIIQIGGNWVKEMKDCFFSCQFGAKLNMILTGYALKVNPDSNMQNVFFNTISLNLSTDRVERITFIFGFPLCSFQT